MIKNSKNAELEKNIGFYCGSSGSGKTHQIKNSLRGAGRNRSVLIWDAEDEYDGPDVVKCESLSEFAGVVFAARANGDRVVVAYAGGNGKAQFEAFCAICWSVRGTEWPMAVVVEELASVTTVSKAPGDWLNILNRGRKYDVWVRAGAQRPAEVDKTVLSQKNLLYVGYLESPADHHYIAAKVALSREQLEKLRPNPYFDHWIIESGKEPVFGTAK